MVQCMVEEAKQMFYDNGFLFLPGTIAEGAPVIPISAQLKYNIDVVCEYITKKIPVPERDFNSQPRLIGKCGFCMKISFVPIALVSPVNVLIISACLPCTQACFVVYLSSNLCSFFTFYYNN